MKARDLMVSPVITVRPPASFREAAELLLKYRINGVPVVNDDYRVVGIVSEGDLLHRAEAGSERQRSWWLLAYAQNVTLAQDYIKAHSRRAPSSATSAGHR